MPDANYVELNAYRPLLVDLTRGGTDLDVSTANAIWLTLVDEADESSIIVDHQVMSVVGGDTNRVSYQLTATQLAAGKAGTYRIQIELQWVADGPSEAIEMGGQRVVVGEHYGTHPS